MLWQNIAVGLIVAGAAIYVVAKFAGWPVPKGKGRANRGPDVRVGDLVRRKPDARKSDCH